MEVTIMEDCKSVLLDNGVDPPMLMDLMAFIQMSVEARNKLADQNVALEQSLKEARLRVETAENVLNDIYPTIAGRVTHLKQSGEHIAMAEWNRMAQKIYAVIKGKLNGV